MDFASSKSLCQGGMLLSYFYLKKEIVSPIIVLCSIQFFPEVLELEIFRIPMSTIILPSKCIDFKRNLLIFFCFFVLCEVKE